MRGLIKRIFGLQRSIGTVLEFYYYRRFYNLNCVPLAFGYLYTIVAYGTVKQIPLGLPSKVIVENDKQFTPHNHCCFGCRAMPVYWHNSARLEHIEHAL